MELAVWTSSRIEANIFSVKTLEFKMFSLNLLKKRKMSLSEKNDLMLFMTLIEQVNPAISIDGGIITAF